jgi:hypothetical protein
LYRWRIGSPGPSPGGGGQRRGPVEAGKAALGEPPWVADLDQQLGDRYGREPAQLVQRAAAGVDEPGELACEVSRFRVELGDLGAGRAQDPEPQRRRRVEAPAAGDARERGQPRTDLLAVGQLLDQPERQFAQQRLGFCEQVLAVFEQRAAGAPPDRQQLALLVRAGVLAGALERPRQ